MNAVAGCGAVLVTGATGFVGTALCRHLATHGWNVRGVTRQSFSVPAGGNIEFVRHASLHDDVIQPGLFDDVDAVIHLAGRAHASGLRAVERERVFAEDAWAAARLADAAAGMGVRRFVFVSTAKVLGEQSPRGIAFTHDSVPLPRDEYARYKFAAENAVRECAERHGMEWVVIRPVLVYGDGVKGNLATLLRWLAHDRPLPFDGVRNQRSLVALPDLCELLRLSVSVPGVAGERLLASGDRALSTPEICAALAAGLGKPARLVRMPEWIWTTLRALPFTAGMARRLTASFLVDNSRTRTLAGWQPRIDAREGLMGVARDYRCHLDTAGKSRQDQARHRPER